MKEKIFKIEADGDFPFSFYIEKAIPGGTEELMTIKGVASTVNIDHDNERMSESSLKAMAEIINEKSVPLRVEHQKDDNAIVGNVNKAWVDERNQLWIEADLDKSHPGASMLYKALKTGAKLGLSVGGRVKHAVREFSESAGKMIKTFYNVVLDEVSVTSRPANYDAWLVSKSIISKESDGEKYVESPFYKEFLFENQTLDYMQSFAKSIPDASWKKTDINNIDKNMDKDKIKKDSEKETEEKEKSANGGEEKKEPKDEVEQDKTSAKSQEDMAFKSMVMKGFESLTNLITKLKKDSSKEGEETTIMEDKTKAQDDEKESETKEKSSDEKESETKEKAQDDKKETEEASTKDYHIDTMKSILDKMENVSKEWDNSETEDKKKEKSSSDKKEEETTEKSQGNELDKFVASVEKFVDAAKEKFEKGGKRTLGLTEMIVNALRTDPEIQKEIQGMMKEPGFKKSMSFGVPMMRTKDGKAYRLTGVPINDDSVEKSKKDNAGKTFKEVYNKDFSSSASREE